MLHAITSILNSGNIYVHAETELFGAYGFVYHSRKGKYLVVISESLSQDAKREVLVHEITHIIRDLPQKPFIIGLDMQAEEAKGLKDNEAYRAFIGSI